MYTFCYSHDAGRLILCSIIELSILHRFSADKYLTWPFHPPIVSVGGGASVGQAGGKSFNGSLFHDLLQVSVDL